MEQHIPDVDVSDHYSSPPLQVDESGEGTSLAWASKLLGVQPDLLEDALVARLINPGAGSAELVIVPSPPTVSTHVLCRVMKGV